MEKVAASMNRVNASILNQFAHIYVNKSLMNKDS